MTLFSRLPNLLACFTIAWAAQSSVAQGPTPSQPAPPEPVQIEVDQHCNILTLDTHDPAHPRLHSRTDHVICHIEGAHESVQWQKTVRNGATKSVMVDVLEHEFLLQNPYDHAVTFLVHQPVRKNYTIDSDPPPNDLTNSVATFRVVVQPGETARLHVGQHG